MTDIDVEEVTIADLGARMASGELTARALAEAYLSRIESIDAAGPELRSVLEINPDAVAMADALDAERRDGHVRGPLHGIPVLVKDNIETGDAMQTTAGSLALDGAPVPRDATVVERLREAGAVLLGKTNLSEWANFRSMRASSGWSARGGQTRNAYALDRNPSGSSSGSGVAVSANLCAAAVGTETDGSIMSPSNASGIVGIKPTVGVLSRAGIVPIAHTQDTPGPMARTVSDAATLLGAMLGTDPRDAATRDAKSFDALAALDPARLRGARIGVARNMAGFHDRVDALLEGALNVLRDLGAEIVDPADVPHATELEEPEFEVLLHEFKAGLETYLAERPGDGPKTLAEIIAFNVAHADTELAIFGQELLERSSEKGPLTEPVYIEALATCRRLAREEGIDAAIRDYRLDAIVAPTGAPAWLTDHVNGDAYLGGNSGPAAIAGYPSVTVPMGLIAGLPVGISFIGPAWSDASLIGYAVAFERATGHRRVPRLLASAGDA
jgi:amidase